MKGVGVKMTPQEKLPSKSPALLGLKDFLDRFERGNQREPFKV